jgi:hypothetical protein
MHRLSGALALRAGMSGLLGALLALPAMAEQPGVRQLRIESDPPGAEVLLIGGSAGHTPLSVGERAIYPNDYSDEQAPLYGLVTLSRAGCATHVQRVTLDDIERGMHVRLDCDPAAAVTASAVTSSPATATAADESVSQRRLRQLQVLQELLDEGLMSAAEEQRIRRALLK